MIAEDFVTDFNTVLVYVYEYNLVLVYDYNVITVNLDNNFDIVNVE